MRHSEPSPSDLCVCGHERRLHYDYILNGHLQSHCKGCDPMVGMPPGNYKMASDSYMRAMYHAADHDFKLDPERFIS